MTELEFSDYLRANFKPSKRATSQRRRVHGFGINDADYVTQPTIDGERAMCPAYSAWRHMIERAYCAKLHEKRPTYIGVTVCDEWRSFMAFREWWLINHVDGWELDKDLLSGEREYSPDACIYVPQWLNSFSADRRAARGYWPIGVYFHKRDGKFGAQCQNMLAGKNEHLGYFACPEKAHQAWLRRKLELADEMKPMIDSIDPRIYPRVIQIIHGLK